MTKSMTMPALQTLLVLIPAFVGEIAMADVPLAAVHCRVVDSGQVNARRFVRQIVAEIRLFSFRKKEDVCHKNENVSFTFGRYRI